MTTAVRFKDGVMTASVERIFTMLKHKEQRSDVSQWLSFGEGLSGDRGQRLSFGEGLSGDRGQRFCFSDGLGGGVVCGFAFLVKDGVEMMPEGEVQFLVKDGAETLVGA